MGHPAVASRISARTWSPASVRSLAVFRALQLGDMLCAVPALRALRAGFPRARITLIGLPWAEQFVRRFSRYMDDFIAFPGHPGFPEQPPPPGDTLVTFFEDLRLRRFDLAVQMHGSGGISNPLVARFGAGATAGHFDPAVLARPRGDFLGYSHVGAEPVRLLRLAEFLGAPSRGAHLEFPLGIEDERELAATGIERELKREPYICIHPGARSRDKCWPPERFAEVADHLAAEFGLRVVLTGSAKESDLTAAVAAAMRTPAIDAASPISIGAMATLMSRACLLVCNDTGVSHIAAGLRLPSVVIFSKADIHRWSPLDRRLHRCLWDPEGKEVPAVLAAARVLLREHCRGSARSAEVSIPRQSPGALDCEPLKAAIRGR